MGADMMARTLYLPADTAIHLAAAKTLASELCQHATLDELRTLLEHGWIGDDTLPDPDSRSGDNLAAHAGHLRQLAEQELHKLLDRFARSLHSREVYRHRFDHDDTPGVDAYITGGPSYGDGPTDAFDDWDVVFDDDRFPDRWAAQLGAAAGLLHPWGDGPAAATVTFHAWN
jgi:hypothetical protein